MQTVRELCHFQYLDVTSHRYTTNCTGLLPNIKGQIILTTEDHKRNKICRVDTFWDDKPVGDIHFVNFENLNPTSDITGVKREVKRAPDGSKRVLLNTTMDHNGPQWVTTDTHRKTTDHCRPISAFYFQKHFQTKFQKKINFLSKHYFSLIRAIMQ